MEEAPGQDSYLAFEQGICTGCLICSEIAGGAVLLDLRHDLFVYIVMGWEVARCRYASCGAKKKENE